MKFSENWLRSWVNPDISSEALSEQLSMAGLEVDGLEPVAADFHTVVVGKVVECGPHPDADKLVTSKLRRQSCADIHRMVCCARLKSWV